MIYGYCRVSTKGQADNNSFEEQEQKILKEYPEAEIVKEAYSGAKERPMFVELIHKLEAGDKLVVCKLDRFCRDTKEGLQYIDELTGKGVSIHILNMGLIDDTPMGKLIVTNLLAFAEFERAMIIERTQSGKAIAKENDPNFREGRPKKYSPEQLNHAMDLLHDHSYNKVAQLTGISKSTLIREKNRRKAKTEMTKGDINGLKKN